jgi:hypothetical protein
MRCLYSTLHIRSVDVAQPCMYRSKVVSPIWEKEIGEHMINNVCWYGRPAIPMFSDSMKSKKWWFRYIIFKKILIVGKLTSGMMEHNRMDLAWKVGKGKWKENKVMKKLQKLWQNYCNKLNKLWFSNLLKSIKIIKIL